MTTDFDPYLKWLGIRDAERPPNHYRLLGLDLFESDPEVINGAADRQMSHVRTFQSGPNAAHSQRLLSELAIARRCLLNSNSRQEYDSTLRSQQPSNAAPVPEPAIAKLVQPTPQPPPLPTAGITGSNSIGQQGVAQVTEPRIRATKKRNKKNRIWIDILGWVGGAVAALAFGYFLIQSGYLDGNNKPVEDTDFVDPVVISKGNNANLDTDPVKPVTPTVSERDRTPKTVTNRKTDLADDPKSNQPGNSNATSTINRDTNPKDGETNLKPTTVRDSATNRNSTDSTRPPWQIRRRLPIFPATINLTRVDRDPVSAIQLAISQREYQIAIDNWPKAKSEAQLRSKPVDYLKMAQELEQFWEKVRSATVLVRPGDTLQFHGEPVKVEKISRRSIELRHSGSIKRFDLDPRKMDRDLAVGLANRVNDLDPTLRDLFLANDFAHIKIKLPRSLTQPTNQNVLNSGAMDPPAPKPVKPVAVRKDPVPDAQSLRKQIKKLEDLYANEYDDNRILSQKSLANRFYRDAMRQSDSTMAYALLEEAVRLSSSIGDGTAALDSLREMNDRFEIDFWDEARKAILDDSYRNGRDTGAQLTSVVNAFFELIPMAVADGKFDLAAKYANKGATSAKKYKDEYQVDTLEEYKKQLKEMVTLQSKFESSKEQLKTDPKNGAAHTLVGTYSGFVMNDWKTALTHFEKCDDAELKSLAVDELTLKPGNASDIIRVAQKWYAAADTFKSPCKVRGAKTRALYWFKQCVDQVTGLDKRLADKMIDELELYDDFFHAYMDDQDFIQDNIWQFGLIVEDFRVSRLGRIDYRENNSRRSLRYTKTGDTFDITAPGSQYYYKMRLQRNRQLEFKKFDSLTGRLEWTLIGIRTNR